MIFLICALILLALPVQAEEAKSGHDLGQVGAKLANPLGELWALSMSFNTPQFYDGDVNSGDPEVGGSMLFQPVLPIPIKGTGKDQWRIITRPVIPFVFSSPIPRGYNDFSHKGGIGDIQLPLLLSVPDRIAGNLILGAGPVGQIGLFGDFSRLASTSCNGGQNGLVIS